MAIILSKHGKWIHHCPNCHRLIAWAMTFCSDCSWRNQPRVNIPWERWQLARRPERLPIYQQWKGVVA